VTDAGLVLGTFAFAFLGGMVPVLNVEIYLVGVAVALPEAGLVSLLMAATLGQVLAKALVYAAGRGGSRLSFLRRGRLEGVVSKLSASEAGTRALLLASAVFGVPPYYAVSLAAGMLRVEPAVFLLIGLGGRTLRFAAVLLLPRLFAGEGVLPAA
jgi:membrane protein YqaA with SNARE-associated domain